MKVRKADKMDRQLHRCRVCDVRYPEFVEVSEELLNGAHIDPDRRLIKVARGLCRDHA
jgi:hypothetical protein